MAELATVGILILFAIIGSIISTKFKQPYVLGLMVAGAIIGPNALNIVHDTGMIEMVLEFGAVLFLFVIGLEFSVKQLMKIGMKGFIIALFKMAIMFFIGFIAVFLLKLDMTTAIFVAVILSFSSTMITMNILKQKKLIHRKEVPILLAILIIEDITGVFVLNVFDALANKGEASVISSLGMIIINLFILVIIYLIASKFAERIVRWLAKNTGEEVLAFISLGLCAGFASLAYLLHVSPAAGAFLAGSVVANFRESKSFEHVTKPYSFMFTSFFFIAIGTMINFGAVGRELPTILVMLVVMVVGMFISVGVVGRIFAGFNVESQVFSSAAMIPMGIFSLLVARASTDFPVGSDLVTATSIVMFILAISASFLVDKSKEISTRFQPNYTKKKGPIEAFSSYISAFFENLDIENEYTRKLKKKTKSLLVRSLLLIIGIVLAAKAIALLTKNHYIIIGCVLAATAIYYYSTLRKLKKETIRLLTNVLARMDGANKTRRARRIVNSLLASIIFLLLGMFEPFIVFTIQLGPKYAFIGLFMVLIGLYCLTRTYGLIRGFNPEKDYTRYPKVHVSMMRA